MVAFGEQVSAKSDVVIKVTNRKLLNSMVLRIKIQQMAAKLDLRLPQLLMLAIFKTVNREWPEMSTAQSREKLYRLAFLLRGCWRLRVPMARLPLGRFYELKLMFL